MAKFVSLLVFVLSISSTALADNSQACEKPINIANAEYCRLLNLRKNIATSKEFNDAKITAVAKLYESLILEGGFASIKESAKCEDAPIDWANNNPYNYGYSFGGATGGGYMSPQSNGLSAYIGSVLSLTPQSAYTSQISHSSLCKVSLVMENDDVAIHSIVVTGTIAHIGTSTDAKYVMGVVTTVGNIQ
jgi:hypothetical protein